MIGLIISAAEGGLISCILPESDGELDGIVLNEGEALLRITNEQYTTSGTAQGLQLLVNQITGKPTPPVRQAIVNSAGDVVDVIRAYPSTFHLADGFAMIAHELAVAGDKFVNGEWVSVPKPDPELVP